MSGVELTELFDALAPDASILVVEAVLENRREDFAEGVNGADRLEDGSNTLPNRLLAVADLQSHKWGVSVDFRSKDW